MAGNSDNAESILVSVTFGGVFLGVAIAVSWERVIDDVVIRGEGKTTPSSTPVIHEDAGCVVDFLEPPAITDYTTSGPLVINTLMSGPGAAAKTQTLGNMVPRGDSYQFNRDAPPAVRRQRFRLVGDTMPTP